MAVALDMDARKLAITMPDGPAEYSCDDGGFTVCRGEYEKKIEY